MKTRRNSLELLVPGAFVLKPSEKVQDISLSSIQPNRYQPRKQFTEKSIQELADSIKSRGLLQPIVIRPFPDQEGQYEIVAGERRVRAFRLLEKETIPAIVRNYRDEDIRILALVENLQREDLSLLEKSDGFVALMKEGGLTINKAADVLGIHERTGAIYSKIGKADTFYKEIILKNDIGMHPSDFLISFAKEIEKADDPESLALFKKFLLEGKVTQEFLDDLHAQFFGSKKEDGDMKEKSKEKNRKSGMSRESGFWKTDKEAVLKLRAPLKFGEISSDEMKQIETSLDRFGKAIGAEIKIKFGSEKHEKNR